MTSKIAEIPSAGDLQVLRGAARAEQLASSVNQPRKDRPQDIEQAAADFEALLLHQMFQSMWATVPQQGLISGGREEQYFRDMFTEGLARDISQGPGIGIKEVIMRELTAKYSSAEEDAGTQPLDTNQSPAVTKKTL